MANSKKKPYDPRIYMQMAIEEMQKSINEPRSDGKTPPKVGAVLLSPEDSGKITAYRGELREGDHAEYSLLERKLGHKKLDNSILFSTLEPCVQRTPPKVGCCKRVVKSRIKTVYVGITDPDPTVDGEGIRYMEAHGTEVIMFDRDLQKIIEKENIEFISQAKERKENSKNKTAVPVLKKTVANADLTELSNEALQKFITDSGLDFELGSDDFKNYLVDIAVLALSEQESSFLPTTLGLLLFGSTPRRHIPQAAFKASVNYGEGNIEPQTFDQPLVLVPDLVEEWLSKALPHSKDTSSFKRKDIPDFPIQVLREAVINAIVHRDYELEGAKSSIHIDLEKIVVKSPGEPLPSISLSQLNSFNAPSISRNPRITYVFDLMGYVEETGLGMTALKSLKKDYDLPLPEYAWNDPFLELTFPRSIETVTKVSRIKNLTELSIEELNGFEWLKVAGEISKKDYAAHFEFDDKKALRHLSKMKNLGLLKDNEEPTNSPKYRYIAVSEF